MAIDLSVFTGALTAVEIADGLKPILLLGFTAVGAVAVSRDTREIKVLLFPLYVFFATAGRSIYFSGGTNLITTILIGTILGLLWVTSTLQVNTFSSLAGANSVFKKTFTEAGALKKAAAANAQERMAKRQGNLTYLGQLNVLRKEKLDSAQIGRNADKTESLIDKLNRQKAKIAGADCIKPEVTTAFPQQSSSRPHFQFKNVLNAPMEHLQLGAPKKTVRLKVRTVRSK